MAQGVFTREQLTDPYPDGVEHHYWTLARSSVIADLTRKAGHAHGIALEVGAGRGPQVTALRRVGIDAIGVELADHPPLRDAKSFMFTGRDAAGLPTAIRDEVRTLLLLDVLEHVADPAAMLRDLIRILPKVERLVVTVPARQELWSNFDEHYGHLQRYQTDEVEDMVRLGGFTARSSGYFFHGLYLPARLQIALGLRRSTVIGPPAPIFRWMHRLLANVFHLDFHLVPRWVPGTSCWCIADLTHPR